MCLTGFSNLLFSYIKMLEILKVSKFKNWYLFSTQLKCPFTTELSFGEEPWTTTVFHSVISRSIQLKYQKLSSQNCDQLNFYEFSVRANNLAEKPQLLVPYLRFFLAITLVGTEKMKSVINFLEHKVNTWSLKTNKNFVPF